MNYEVIQVDRMIVEVKQEIMKLKIEVPELSGASEKNHRFRLLSHQSLPEGLSQKLRT